MFRKEIRQVESGGRLGLLLLLLATRLGGGGGGGGCGALGAGPVLLGRRCGWGPVKLGRLGFLEPGQPPALQDLGRKQRQAGGGGLEMLDAHRAALHHPSQVPGGESGAPLVGEVAPPGRSSGAQTPGGVPARGVEGLGGGVVGAGVAAGGAVLLPAGCGRGRLAVGRVEGMEGGGLGGDVGLAEGQVVSLSCVQLPVHMSDMQWT